MQIPDGNTIMVYDDDIAIVEVDKEMSKLEAISYLTILVVQVWLSIIRLALAEHKTKAILVSSVKIRDTMTVSIGDHIIDDRLNFWEQLAHISGPVVQPLDGSSICGNVAPHSQHRRLPSIETEAVNRSSVYFVLSTVVLSLFKLLQLGVIFTAESQIQ